MKLAGLTLIHNVESLDACVAALGRHPKAMLILDWEHGAPQVNATLRHAKGVYGIDTRPIFLIAAEMSTPIIAVAAEYYVSRVHAGEISRGLVQEHLDAIVDQESADHGLRRLLTRVADARARGDWSGATRLLEEMRTKFPDDRRIACELAESLIHENRWHEASELVGRLSVTSRMNLRVQHLKARCLMKRGAFDEAAAILADTSLINPFNVERLVDLGRAYMQVDRVRDALDAFREALALDPSSKEASQGELQCKLINGEVNDALELMRQMTTARELASLFNNAAILSIRHGRFDHGLSLYHTAIGTLGSKDGLVSRLFYNLGLAYHKQGRPGASLGCFERALRIDQGFEKARHNAHIVAVRLGRRTASEGPGMESSRLSEGFADVNEEEGFSTTEAYAAASSRD